MARITVSPQYDLPAIITAAGGNPNAAGVVYSPDPALVNSGALEVPGVTQSALDTALAAYDHRAVLQARAIAKTKRIAGEKILKVAPEWKQRNLTARGVDLLEKGKANWTVAEQAEIAAMKILWGRVKALRIASNQIEADVAAMNLATVAAFDPALSLVWPE